MMAQPLRDGASTGKKFATEDHEYDPNQKLIELSEETEDKHTDLPQELGAIVEDRSHP